MEHTDQHAPQPILHVSLVELYRVFAYIGLMSFGGGLVPWIQREIVNRRGWMTNHDFLPGVALSQVLPGVNSTNLAIFIGQQLRGLPGAAVAIGGLLTGPFIIMIGAAATYKVLLDAPALQVAMSGVAAAAIGMILRTGMIAVQSSGAGLLSIVVMVATFLAIGVFRFPLLWVVAIITPLSVLAAWPRGDKSGDGGGDDGGKGRNDA